MQCACRMPRIIDNKCSSSQTTTTTKILTKLNFAFVNPFTTVWLPADRWFCVVYSRARYTALWTFCEWFIRNMWRRFISRRDSLHADVVVVVVDRHLGNQPRSYFRICFQEHRTFRHNPSNRPPTQTHAHSEIHIFSDKTDAWHNDLDFISSSFDIFHQIMQLQSICLTVCLRAFSIVGKSQHSTQSTRTHSFPLFIALTLSYSPTTTNNKMTNSIPCVYTIYCLARMRCCDLSWFYCL